MTNKPKAPDEAPQQAQPDELATLRAENARLREALEGLRAILCDPSGTPCFSGSDGDRSFAAKCFGVLAQTEAENG